MILNKCIKFVLHFPHFSRHASITPQREKTDAGYQDWQKTQKYTTEFKIKAVEWSHQEERSIII